MTDAGCIQGVASPFVFHHPTRNIACSVHGDDFTAAGSKAELDWFEATLKKSCELTVGGRLGPGPTDDKEATVLGRVIRWTDIGIEYEAESRQVEKLISELQLEGEAVKGVVTPGVKVLSHQVQSETAFPESEHTRLRGLAARANLLAADRPDIVYSAKGIGRFMAKPTDLATQALISGLLEETPKDGFQPPVPSGKLDRGLYGYGLGGMCPNFRTRKSTSGGCRMSLSHATKFWSTK